jgi:hypothetical protein
MSGNGAYQGEMSYEVSLFESALRVAVPTQPDPRLGADLVPRLAQAARASTIEAETRASSSGAAWRRGRARSRRALVARVGFAVALLPLTLAGLAFAGVTLPDPAQSAFDRVGITLPNQATSDSSTTSSGQPASGATDQTDTVSGEGNSHAAHQHALQQRQKAWGKAIDHTRGQAIGLNESTPPGKSGDTGPPNDADAGASAKSNSAPGQVRDSLPPSSRGRGTGR